MVHRMEEDEYHQSGNAAAHFELLNSGSCLLTPAFTMDNKMNPMMSRRLPVAPGVIEIPPTSQESSGRVSLIHLTLRLLVRTTSRCRPDKIARPRMHKASW